MAISISDVEMLQEYLNGVVNRADHHARNVNLIVLTLLGAVIARNTGEIRVREYRGRTANSLWFEVNDVTYVLKYDHEHEHISLVERTEQGTVINSFTNSDTAADVWEVFSAL